MTALLFNIIGFACLGITLSMQLGWLNTKFSIPTLLRCNKCLAFWLALGYNLTQLDYVTALLMAAVSAVLSIIIYNRL